MSYFSKKIAAASLVSLSGGLYLWEDVVKTCYLNGLDCSEEFSSMGLPWASIFQFTTWSWQCYGSTKMPSEFLIWEVGFIWGSTAAWKYHCSCHYLQHWKGIRVSLPLSSLPHNWLSRRTESDKVKKERANTAWKIQAQEGTSFELETCWLLVQVHRYGQPLSPDWNLPPKQQAHFPSDPQNSGEETWFLLHQVEACSWLHQSGSWLEVVGLHGGLGALGSAGSACHMVVW